jgi:hypothetical protein
MLVAALMVLSFGSYGVINQPFALHILDLLMDEPSVHPSQGAAPKVSSSLDKRTGKTNVALRFQTLSKAVFNVFHTLFYANGTPSPLVPPCPWPQPRAAGKGTDAQAYVTGT